MADSLFWVLFVLAALFVIYPFEGIPLLLRLPVGVLFVCFVLLFYAVIVSIRRIRFLEDRILQVERAFTGMREGFGVKFEKKG